MTERRDVSRPWHRRWWLERVQPIALAVTVTSLVTVVFALSAIFAATDGSVEVAETGSRGIYAEAALSAAATTRNRAVQAYLIRSATDEGVAGEESLRAATGAVEAGIGELAVRIDRLEHRLDDRHSFAELRRAASDFSSAVMTLLGLLEQTDQQPRAVDILQEVDDRYLELSGRLVAERDAVVAELELATEDAGRIATATRVVVAVAVPIGIALLLRRILRRRHRRVLLEQELERQRQVVETKDLFIADLSHQLRTPLTSIVGFASTLIDKRVVRSPEATTEFATLIAMDAEELSRMVDDLLTAGRAKTETLELSRRQVDPAAAVEAVVGPMEAWGIVVDRDMEPAVVAADPGRLRQVMRDLTSNAVKHGGPPVRITGKVGDGGYVFEVVDHGGGVPPDLEERLYERYIHRGRDPLVAGSVGLGLAVSSMLVDLMGGELSYRRADGATVFSVTLPLWSQQATKVDAVPDEESAVVPSGVLDW